MIELYINGSLCDLNGNESITIDYAMFSIDDISRRKGSRSYTFTIPKTTRNRQILEVSEEVNNLTQIPYTKLTARLLDNGVDLGIKFAELTSVKDGYSINLYGNSISFFDLIKNKKLIELDMSDYNHVYNFTNVVASKDNTDGYIYPIINYGADESVMGNIERKCQMGYLLPAFYLDTLLERIVTEAGYGYENKMLAIDDYVNNPIVLPSVDIRKGNKYNAKFEIGNDAQCVPNYYGAVNIMSIDSIVTYDGSYYSLPYPSFFRWGSVYSYGNGIQIIDNFSCKITFTITVNNSDTNSHPLHLYLSGDTSFHSGAIQIGSVICVAGTHTYTITATLDNSNVQWGGSYYTTPKLFFPIGSPFLTVQSGGTVEITEADEQSLIYLNGTVVVSSLLPDFKQSDIIRNYCQMFGLIPIVDEITKTVTFERFNKISENVNNALDWSDKLDLTNEPEIKFLVDEYGQNNYFKWLQDGDEQQPIGTNGNIVISNENLEKEKDIVKLDFASTFNDLMLLNIPVPRIGLFEQQLYKKDKKPRMLILYRKSPSDFDDASDFVYFQGLDTYTLSGLDLIPLCRFIDTDFTYNLGFGNNLLQYYRAINDVLDRYRNVNCLIRLNASDINKLDFTKPIYIKYFNSYFYLNLIQGYKAGANESTHCELIKLF